MALQDIFGIGKGGAQVWQGNPGLNMLMQQYQKDQQQKQAEDNQYMAEFAKTNYDGVRQADTKKAIELYDDIKNTFGRLRAVRDPYERNVIANDMRTKQRMLSQFVDVSKQNNANIKKLGELRLVPTNNLKGDFGTNWTTLNSTASDDPQFAKQSEYFNDPFEPKYDVAALSKRVFDNSKVTSLSPIQQEKIGELQTAFQTENTSVDPHKVATFYQQQYLSDPAFRKFVNANYVGEGKSPVDGLKAFTEEAITNFAPSYEKTERKPIGSRWDERPDTMTEYQRRSLALREAAANKETQNAATYWQDLVNRMGKGSPGSGEEFKAAVAGKYPGRTVQIINPKARVKTIKIPAIGDGQGANSEKRGEFDFSTPEGKIKAALFMSNVLGESLPISAFLTEGGKKKVAGGMGVNEIKETVTVKISPEDQGALNWMKANPSDPRAKAIRDRLKQKGVIK